MMFARRAGAQPDKRTRQALYWRIYGFVSDLVSGFSYRTVERSSVRLAGNSDRVSRWEQMILGVAFLGLSAYGLIGLARQAGWRKLAPSLTLFSSQFLWFLLPTAISFAAKSWRFRRAATAQAFWR